MKFMRDAFIEQVYKSMITNEKIVFITADVGAPMIDSIKEDFPDRFINIGIAEQNMINVTAGLAMEGFEVYAYGITSFFLRCVDQIRNSLLLTNQMNKLNVNLLSTGKGVSYETAGPAHHCLEDLPVLDILPGIELFVPSDPNMAKAMAAQIAIKPGVKYFSFEGKKTHRIYPDDFKHGLFDGFIEHNEGDDVCVVSQGSALNLAIEVVESLIKKEISVGLIDVFTSQRLINTDKLLKIISKYKKVIITEEGYREKGFLNSTINELTRKSKLGLEVFNFGFDDQYIFEIGPREMHYKLCGMSVENIINKIL